MFIFILVISNVHQSVLLHFLIFSQCLCIIIILLLFVLPWWCFVWIVWPFTQSIGTFLKMCVFTTHCCLCTWMVNSEYGITYLTPCHVTFFWCFYIFLDRTVEIWQKASGGEKGEQYQERSTRRDSNLGHPKRNCAFSLHLYSPLI